MHPWVRDDKVGLVDAVVAMEQDVDIERPWPPALGADASGVGLEALHELEQLTGSQRRLDGDDGVQVLRLWWATYRVRLIDR